MRALVPLLMRYERTGELHLLAEILDVGSRYPYPIPEKVARMVRAMAGEAGLLDARQVA